MTTQERIDFYVKNFHNFNNLEMFKLMGWKNKSSLLRFVKKHRIKEVYGLENKLKAKICEVYKIHKNKHLPVKHIASIINRNRGFVVNNYKKFYGVDLTGTEQAIKNRSSNQFKKGIIPHNKGKSIDKWASKEAIERQKKNRFKKGEQPHNTKPIGSEWYCERQGIFVKQPNSKWKLKSHVIWEKEKGYKVTQGYGVGYKDGNKRNCVIENLYIITPEELIHKNIDKTEYSETKFLLHKINKELTKWETT